MMYSEDKIYPRLIIIIIMYAPSGKEISKLNSELINPHTFPLILNNKTQSKLVEIDTSDDLKKYKGIT